MRARGASLRVEPGDEYGETVQLCAHVPGHGQRAGAELDVFGLLALLEVQE